MNENEVVAPVENVEAEQQPAESSAESVQPEPQESEQAKNFRQLRQKAEKAERERDELLRKMSEMEQQRVQPKVEEDDEINLAPDDLAEGKHLSKVGRKIKKLEEQLRKYEQQSSEISVEAKIKAQYPDFDKVVSQETLNTLKDEYPELFSTLHNSPDLYSKAISAYTLIKKFGLSKEAAYQADIDRAQKNVAKPRPLASVAPQHGDGPLSKANAFANGLTPELQQALYKEMMDVRKGN